MWTFQRVWVNKYPGVGLLDQTPIILKTVWVSIAPTLVRFGGKQPSPSAPLVRHPGAWARPDGDSVPSPGLGAPARPQQPLKGHWAHPGSSASLCQWTTVSREVKGHRQRQAKEKLPRPHVQRDGAGKASWAQKADI